MLYAWLSHHARRGKRGWDNTEWANGPVPLQKMTDAVDSLEKDPHSLRSMMDLLAYGSMRLDAQRVRHGSAVLHRNLGILPCMPFSINVVDDVDSLEDYDLGFFKILTHGHTTSLKIRLPLRKSEIALAEKLLSERVKISKDLQVSHGLYVGWSEEELKEPSSEPDPGSPDSPDMPLEFPEFTEEDMKGEVGEVTVHLFTFLDGLFDMNSAWKLSALANAMGEVKALPWVRKAVLFLGECSLSKHYRSSTGVFMTISTTKACARKLEQMMVFGSSILAISVPPEERSVEEEEVEEGKPEA